jgi:GTP-binding protein EngB required for normal cell division
MTSSYFIPISGRPNAGKTSLINFLASTKNPVGKKAGTTLRIVKIPLTKDLFLVDLPGYGRITKRSKKIENQIKTEIVQYLDNFSNQFLFAIHVIDFSTFHFMVQNLEQKGIIPIDIEFIQFLAEKINLTPFLVLNKIDKVKQSLIEENLDLLRSYELPEIEIFILSLKTKVGCRFFRNRVKERVVQELGPKYQNW